MNEYSKIHETFKDNPLAWGYYFFPEHFRSASPPFHLEILKAILNNKKTAIQAPRGSGKAQPLYSKVLTPDGFKNMGDIFEGSYVVGKDGRPKKVNRVYPQGSKDIYEISFSDGSKTRSTDDHLWTIRNGSSKWRVEPLNNIRTKKPNGSHGSNYVKWVDSEEDKPYLYKRAVGGKITKPYASKYYIPTTNPVLFNNNPLKIHPYVLGALLGDGGISTNGIRFSSEDKEVVDRVNELLPDEYVLKFIDRYDYRLCHKEGRLKGNKSNTNPVLNELRELNLMGTNSHTKFIPKQYLLSSIEDRIELLKGLMDTDGTVSGGSAVFSTVSKKLMEGVVDIVLSLGGRAMVNSQIKKCHYKNGTKSEGSLCYNVHIQFIKGSINPFYLKRKKNKINYKLKSVDRAITDIKYVGKEECQCLSVEDQHYLTDNYIVTHNTTLINLLLPAWGICFKRFKNIIILQASENKSMENLASIKEEFEHNEVLRNTYNVKFDKDAAKKSIFELPCGWRTQITCFGREQMGKIRGAKFGAYRPDLIIIDDLEDDEMVRNRDIREELHRVYKDAVEPAIDTMMDFRIVYIDTMKHYDSQLAKLLSDEMYPDYTKLRFAARYEKDGKKYSLWKEKWSLELLDKLEKEDPINFYKEYQGDPITADAQTFKADDFMRWTAMENEYICYEKDGGILTRGSLSDCKVGIGYDLAWDEKRRHDYTAVVPVYLTPEGYSLVDFYTNEKGVKPDKLSDIIFSLDDKYRAITGKQVGHGFEKGKYEKVAKWYLSQEMKKRNKYVTITDMSWVTDKKERVIAPLQPRYAQNVVFHRKGMGELESQLCRFPSGAHDDLPDALQNAVRLLSSNPQKLVVKHDSQDDKFNKLRSMFETKKPVRGLLNHKKSYSIKATNSINLESI